MEETGLEWTLPGWRLQAEQWIRERLAEVGRSVAAIEQPHARPWGTALRVQTTNGTLWFKACVAPLAYELPLLEHLGAARPDCVPHLVATDAARAWMLLDDAGVRLVDLYPDGAPAAIWQEFLRVYAQLQIDVAPAAEELVAAGVPDARSPRLIEEFLGMLENRRLVQPPVAGALDDHELARLRAQVPRLVEASETLAALGLPDSIQHDDLHQWNVCVRDGRYRFIDWGDACVAQPLLSLAVPLEHGAPAEARDALLEPWTAFRPLRELAAATGDAVLLGQVTGVLKEARWVSVLSDAVRADYEDEIPIRLRRLLELACA
jgi:hypothetical protein